MVHILGGSLATSTVLATMLLAVVALRPLLVVRLPSMVTLDHWSAQLLAQFLQLGLVLHVLIAASDVVIEKNKSQTEFKWLEKRVQRPHFKRSIYYLHHN